MKRMAIKEMIGEVEERGLTQDVARRAIGLNAVCHGLVKIAVGTQAVDVSRLT
jgi:hypothetical protein